MGSHYILELTLPNSYTIFIVAEASDEESAKSSADSIIEALQPIEVQIHYSNWILNHTIPQPAIWLYIAQQQKKQKQGMDSEKVDSRTKKHTKSKQFKSLLKLKHYSFIGVVFFSETLQKGKGSIVT